MQYGQCAGALTVRRLGIGAVATRETIHMLSEGIGINATRYKLPHSLKEGQWRAIANEDLSMVSHVRVSWRLPELTY